ncbi:O-succinylbenzoic acid--CoA ligase [Terracoccus luteus]|uniref:O-succinylbenzoic acid--CoA ligase n=1 Tax=Terracoccus luteus TaxID=53356 RepID=A0A495XWF5_9MICO|nr:o-succinylbenzoate--CoA ligase [Terracoccus luteus]RKT78901.1 O-succinylbenzoic acid--CoA ligase [Terracoccus luteus]
MTSAVPEPLAVPAGPDVLGLLPRLESALSGGRPVMPHAHDEPAPALPDPVLPGDLPDGLALAIGTSGSTGRPKRALLTAEALRRSADATHESLGGSGAWLLAMPAHHIAGLQVLLRSVAAGTVPAVLDLRPGFTPEAFVAAAREVRPSAGAGRRYTALVPTQLGRILEHPAATEALAGFDAVLVGGAATASSTLARARRAGIPLRLTYGMSETAGGCVYDGSPLPGSRVHIDNDHHVVLGGDTVAHGYLGDPERTADSFSVDPDGVRWFRTDDLGHFDDDERLVIDGRADDVINSGALKVTPGVVEDAMLRHLPEVHDVVVVGVPDPEWGEIVCAAVTLADPAATVDEAGLRERLRGILPDAALPRRVLVVTSIPQRGPGKPDRAAIRRAVLADG